MEAKENKYSCVWLKMRMFVLENVSLIHLFDFIQTTTALTKAPSIEFQSNHLLISFDSINRANYRNSFSRVLFIYQRYLWHAGFFYKRPVMIYPRNYILRISTIFLLDIQFWIITTHFLQPSTLLTVNPMSVIFMPTSSYVSITI